MVEELNANNFDQATSKGLVVVDLWAPWCVPCKKLGPVIEELSQQYAGVISFYKLNIDEHKEPSVIHQVMSIPTLLLFKEGALVDRLVGVSSKEKIILKLEGLK